MQDMIIRNALEDDFTKIAELADDCEPMTKERNAIYHLFTRFFKSTCLVAEISSGEIRGFILGFISQENPEECYIHQLCVDSKLRHKNIGTELVNSFIQNVSSKGCKKVSLLTKTINWNSINFYKKLGFMQEKSGETINVLGNTAIKNYDGPGEHMILFYKLIEKYENL